MSADTVVSGLAEPEALYIAGRWLAPSSARMFDVTDSNDEEIFLRVAEASEPDVAGAVDSARSAFDHGSWTSLTHVERAAFLRAMANALRTRTSVFVDMWPRESGALQNFARSSMASSADMLDYYADLAATFEWEQFRPRSSGGDAVVLREPVGVVAAIVPWNSPLKLAVVKIAPALLSGCTVVLKASPEAPASAYLLAEAANEAAFPPGVFNMITADRAASEALVRDSRVDKVAFTGSTATGRRIASIVGERIGRASLELGGKSPALVLDDADIAAAAHSIAMSECILTGQVCSSLTRVIVPRGRHDEMVDALAAVFEAVRVGSSLDASSQMGPLATERQRDRVEHYIATGVKEGATLVVGGGRPAHLDRGYFIEPTVFGNVDNSATIAQEEIFGPVLSVIPVEDQEAAISTANDTIYGLNASVFTADEDCFRAVARRLRAGSVSHNGFRSSAEVGYGGFKQSGIGREGGPEGVLAYVESKSLLPAD